MMRYFLPLIALIALSAAACGDGVDVADWRLTSLPVGSTLQIEVGVGDSCHSLYHVKVDEFDDLVRITAFVEYSESANGCDDLYQIAPHTVQLKEPLGDRRLEGCDQDVGYRDLHDACKGTGRL